MGAMILDLLVASSQGLGSQASPWHLKHLQAREAYLFCRRPASELPQQVIREFMTASKQQSSDQEQAPVGSTVRQTENDTPLYK